MPTSSTTWRATGRWLPTACLLLTLAVAGALRTYRLPELPVGLHYDEAANGTLAREIAAGSSRPIFIAAYTGKEVLFFYWTALWMRILDATPAALRLSSALVGIATVAAAVWSTDELLGEPNRPWIGLLTAALLAVSFWHLVLSRYGFRAVTQPLLQALTVGALWHGLGPSRRSTLWLILAGLCCGLTGYTYLAARAFPLPLAAALLTVITADQAHRRQRIGQAAIFVLSALLTLAPLAHYWTAHPDTFLNRASQIAAGSWSEVWQGITACAAMLFIRGDPYIRFNLPLRPLFGPALAICFGIGLIIIVHQLIARLPAARGTTTGGIARESTPKTRAAQVFLLTCLPVMLLPSALATGEITPSNLRTVGLIPFVFVFPAVGLHRLFTHVFNQYVARRIPMKPACALALLVVYLVLAAQFESFIHPLVIMLTVPLAVLGALIGLWATGGTLNLFSQIGIVMLVGLAAKNGILIVEFANQLRDAGRSVREAIAEASAVRLRPILMTSAATVMGAVPLVVAGGPGSASRATIGVVIISGVAFATLLSLFVVPAFYALLAPFTRSPDALARKLEQLEAETAPVGGHA